MDHVIYLGCFTEIPAGSTQEASQGIYLLKVSGEGRLTQPPRLLAKQSSPAYFYLTRDRSTLYAVSEPESDRGEVCSYRVGEEGMSLSFLSRQIAAGAGLCHVTMDPPEKNVLVTCYAQATIQSYPVENGQITPMFSLRHHKGSGPVKGRQDEAHTHSITFTPDGRYAIVCDLGMDMLKAYIIVPETGKIHRATPMNFQAPAGTGPRHMVFRPDGKFAYVLCELSSEILVLSYDPETGFSLAGRTSTLSPEYSTTENKASAIRITKDGRFLYASNRGEDTIAMFTIDQDSGLLRLSATSSTRGWYPRDFILTDDGTLLIGANELSDNLVIYRRDPENGRITLTDEQPCPHRPAALMEWTRGRNFLDVYGLP